MSPPHDQPYQGWADTSGRDSATSDGEHEDVESCLINNDGEEEEVGKCSATSDGEREDVEPIEFGEGQFEDEDEEVDSGTRVEEVEIDESECV